MVGFFRRKVGRKVALLAGATGIAVAGVGVYLLNDPPTSRTTIILAGAILAATLATLVGVHRLVILPLGRLSGVIARAEKGDFLIRAPVATEDELGQLARRFNVMLATITDLSATQIDSDWEKELMQRELELQTELAQNVRDLTLLIELTRAITSTLELDPVLEKITEMVGVTLGFNDFTLLLYDAEAGDYVITETYGLGEEAGQVGGLRFHDDEGIIALAHEKRGTVLVPDTAAEPRYLHYKGRRKSDGSLLVIPMIYHDEIVGALAFTRPEVNAFGDEEVRLLETVASQAALAIANARLYEKTVQLSLTDPLTGVFNRRSLGQRLQMELDRARRFGHPLSAVMVDVDHFKKYNDAHGHPMGDGVLQQVAATLRHTVRRVDLVARYGGEEFTVLLPQVPAEQALEVAEKLRQAIEGHAFPGGETQPLGRVTLSLGVATFPDDADDDVTLLDRADAALYHAKSSGRNRAVAYLPGMDSEDAGAAKGPAGSATGTDAG